MPNNGDWTAEWAAKKLRENKHVSSVTVTGPGRLQIERHDMPPVLVATLAVRQLDGAMLATALATVPQPDFVLNLQAGAALNTAALELSMSNEVPVGRLGDLDRALSMANAREYVDRETQFRERGLKQNQSVASFRRLDLHRYYIERHGLSPLTVIFLNDYEVSAEAIRQARADYGSFEIVVASNPNGRVTVSATEVAGQLECEVHQWKAFLSRLRREHDKS